MTVVVTKEGILSELRFNQRRQPADLGTPELATLATI